VHVHGYEPTPLFNEEDPYWEVHNDSRFAPQPSNYERLNLTAMMMKTWLFNKTAWLLHSQVCRGNGLSVDSYGPCRHIQQSDAWLPFLVNARMAEAAVFISYRPC
jgi:hypothetical protein